MTESDQTWLKRSNLKKSTSPKYYITRPNVARFVQNIDDISPNKPAANTSLKMIDSDPKLPKQRNLTETNPNNKRRSSILKRPKITKSDKT